MCNYVKEYYLIYAHHQRNGNTLFDLLKNQTPLTFATTKIKQTDLYYLFYWLFVTVGQEFLLNGLYKQEINIIIDNRSRDFHFLTFKCYSLGRHGRPKRRSHWQSKPSKRTNKYQSSYKHHQLWVSHNIAIRVESCYFHIDEVLWYCLCGKKGKRNQDNVIIINQKWEAHNDITCYSKQLRFI